MPIIFMPKWSDGFGIKMVGIKMGQVLSRLASGPRCVTIFQAIGGGLLYNSRHVLAIASP